ncbi:hypothetical protein ACTU3I_12505 [Microbacterium sp. RD1]|uniref:hypothetical protein n=1 Tax=Microbacterium sp. RD1 TaxID=3457313 RepID=UPI003FA532F0
MVHARRRPSIGTVLGVVAVGAAVLAGLVALGLYLAPRVVPNLEARVAPRDTVERLSSDGASAAVTVPAGWVGQRGWGDDDELVVRSPDGGLSVTFALSPVHRTRPWTTHPGSMRRRRSRRP